jgi:hypothetical protein
MITYYISGSNIIDIRIKPKCSGSLVWRLQNMSSLQNTSASIVDFDYDKYQSLLTFTASVPSPNIGDQYRAEIVSNGTDVVWNGSVQVFASQSIDKVNYVNQIPLEDVYVSNLTDNEYIILD